MTLHICRLCVLLFPRFGDNPTFVIFIAYFYDFVIYAKNTRLLRSSKKAMLLDEDINTVQQFVR